MSTKNPTLVVIFFALCAGATSLAVVGPKSEETLKLEAMQEVYRQNPEYVAVRGHGIWATAVRNGHTQILQWLLGQGIPGQDFTFHGMNIWQFAMMCTQIATLDWLQQHKIPGRNVALMDELLMMSLRENHMHEVAEWIKKTPEFELSVTQTQVVLNAIPFMLAAFRRYHSQV